MRVLGIDPGTLFTGYGVVVKGAGGKLVHVSDGAIAMKDSMPISERLLKISDSLKSVIEEHRPEAVSVETVFFAKNVRSAIMLGQARGAALLSAASFGLPVFEYSPSSVKLAVTGHGSATKDQVQKMVKLLLKSETDSSRSDASDALAIAICHIHHYRELKAVRPASKAKLTGAGMP